MKTWFTILMFTTAFNVSWGQSQSDYQAVLSQCFAHTGMIESEHLNDKGIPVLIIEDNGALSATLEINWFDNPAQFKTTQEITDTRVQAYIVFDSLTLTDDQATAGFSYIRKGGNDMQHFILQFSKEDNEWIKSSI